MTTLVVDVVGWFGAGALLLGYWLVSSDRVHGRSRRFQLLNLAGAAALLLNGVHHGAWPSAGLNSVWLLIGLLALARAGGRRAATPPAPTGVPPSPGTT